MNGVAYWNLDDAETHAHMREQQTGRPWTVETRPVAHGLATTIHHVKEEDS